MEGRRESEALWVNIQENSGGSLRTKAEWKSEGLVGSQRYCRGLQEVHLGSHGTAASEPNTRQRPEYWPLVVCTSIDGNNSRV